MKKFLPAIFIIIFIVAALISPLSTAHAATGTSWVKDAEVTFVGKDFIRSGLVLNWTLANYQWACVKKTAAGNCDLSANPLASFWQKIVVSLVLPLVLLVILAVSAVMIITRGRSLTIMRFIPRFIVILILIVMSFAVIQFLYQAADLIQGIYLRSSDSASCPTNCITALDLLTPPRVNYNDFVGYKKISGDTYTESAFVSVLLVKLTSWTYFIMSAILHIRKIILWFFIIVSPVFPLLFLFRPIQSAGKFWTLEFFRWVLYGPLFTIFLQGLVFIWRNQIPLDFTPGNPSNIIYPNAINIFLAGPGLTASATNNVNLTETLMLYAVALVMLWIVIVLPFILLQLFLSYAASLGNDIAIVKNLTAVILNKLYPTAAGATWADPAGRIVLNLPFIKRSINIPSITKPITDTQETKVTVEKPKQVNP